MRYSSCIMEYEREINRIGREMVFTSSGFVLAYGVAPIVEVFSQHNGELTSVSGKVMAAIGGLCIAAEAYHLWRTRTPNGSPDNDPEKEPVEPSAQIIELRAKSQSNESNRSQAA